MANLPRFAQVVQQQSFLETSLYKCQKKTNQILGIQTIAVTLKVLYFLKSMCRRGFLLAENRLKSPLWANGKIWSLCWRLT